MRVPLLILFTLALAACRYEVRDPQSGTVFYTDRWVAADGYRGPLSFTDHTGRRVELRDAQVNRLSAEDYVEAVERADRERLKP